MRVGVSECVHRRVCGCVEGCSSDCLSARVLGGWAAQALLVELLLLMMMPLFSAVVLAVQIGSGSHFEEITTSCM